MPRLQVDISPSLHARIRSALLDQRAQGRVVTPSMLQAAYRAYNERGISGLADINAKLALPRPPLFTMPDLIEALLTEALDARDQTTARAVAQAPSPAAP